MLCVRMIAHVRRTAASLSLLVIWVALAGVGCQVRLIAEHDPVLDGKISDLQAQVESFLTRMGAKAGTPAGSYAQNEDFYADIGGELLALRSRAEVTPKAELFIRHLDLIVENLERLRGLHEKRGEEGLSKVLVEPARSALEVQLRALLKLNAELRTGRGG